jgi:hypothetical protein
VDKIVKTTIIDQKRSPENPVIKIRNRKTEEEKIATVDSKNTAQDEMTIQEIFPSEKISTDAAEQNRDLTKNGCEAAIKNGSSPFQEKEKITSDEEKKEKISYIDSNKEEQSLLFIINNNSNENEKDQKINETNETEIILINKEGKKEENKVDFENNSLKEKDPIENDSKKIEKFLKKQIMNHDSNKDFYPG